MSVPHGKDGTSPPRSVLVPTDIAVIVGNPKPQSRTLLAAAGLAERLGGTAPRTVIDLAMLGVGLLTPGDQAVGQAFESVQLSRAVVVASPTYRGTYTGLLKVFLDRMPPGALSGTIAFPLMLGAGERHALAAELILKPVLVELGAICPVPGLFLTEDSYLDGPDIDRWLARVREADEVLNGLWRKT